MMDTIDTAICAMFILSGVFFGASVLASNAGIAQITGITFGVASAFIGVVFELKKCDVI